MGLVKGKFAIVTGGGANIGEACAKMLASHGASVVIADINLDGARRVASEIGEAGGTAIALQVDLGNEASVAAMAAAAVAEFGRVDILHNNAANTGAAQMTRDGALTEMEPEVWDAANIRCNAILPGLVLSPVARAQMTAEQLGMIQRHVLLPRESSADDIAGAVLWLASDLSSFVTGQIISADGGICHHQPHYADMIDMFEAAQS
jgi:NAD(P)-dependent dehydrogenase (short-subunit alcohol dehydrogenase family)